MLYSMDRVNILAGEWLTDNIIDTTQKTSIGMGGLQPILYCAWWDGRIY